MNRLSWTIVAFAVGFAAFHIIPLRVWQPLPGYPLIGTGTTFDLFSPLVMLPIYMLMYRWGHETIQGQKAFWWDLLFLALAVIWVEGHSIHLSANVISLSLIASNIGGHPQAVTHLFDEVLGHYLWHLGMVGLSGLLVAREWQAPVPDQPTPWAVILPAAFLYGAIFFGAVIEGGTWPLALTFSVLFCAVSLIGGRSNLTTRPLQLFFTAGYVVSIIGFIVWALVWGGLPQFSDVGIIK